MKQQEWTKTSNQSSLLGYSPHRRSFPAGTARWGLCSRFAVFILAFFPASALLLFQWSWVVKCSVTFFLHVLTSSVFLFLFIQTWFWILCAFLCHFSFRYTTAFLLLIHMNSGCQFRELSFLGAGLAAKEWLTFEFGVQLYSSEYWVRLSKRNSEHLLSCEFYLWFTFF